MKTQIVPHSTDCQHDRVVMHGDTLLICETQAARPLKTASQVAASRTVPPARDVETAVYRKRQEFGLSLGEVATATGITKGYLSQLEHGQLEPGVRRAILLARFYETTVEELFAVIA